MIVIDCPVPPSANRLWRVGKRRVYKTAAYSTWLWEFYVHGLRHHALLRRNFVSKKNDVLISGPFEAEILVCPKRKRDCDNTAKALLDACQQLGIIANDSQARKVTQELVERERAPLGCRLRIIPLG